MVRTINKLHIVYFLGLSIIGTISIIILLVQPHGFPIPELSTTFFLFGLGLNTTILLWTIGGFLLFRWNRTGRKNNSLLAWSLSFFIFSLTFVAHIFRALGFESWNENISVFHFFAFRWVMIVWASGMFYGISKILTDNKLLWIVPSAAILIIGFLWFILGLFVIPSENPIEFTMYLFLFTVWIPICFTISYIFFYYGYITKQNGPKVISLGFFVLMFSYMMWAPWHFSDVVYIYFIWYFVFSLSLVPILLGFVIMTLEEQ